MDHRPKSENGAVLVLVLIFSVLLYIVISQLVTTAKMARLAGANDSLLAKMNNHMRAVALPQVEQLLKDDLSGGDMEGEGGEGGLSGALSGATGGSGNAGSGGAAGEGEQEEEEPPSDSSRDNWYEPTAYSNGDLTTYVWVEDENRKFNLLTLISDDQDFADLSRERLVRLLNGLREDSDFDLTHGDASAIADAIKEWLGGDHRNEDNLPRPELKTDKDGTEISLPLHLDELIFLESVTEDLFYDKVIADEFGEPRLLFGLESVLTIYTSWARDPGDPEKQAQAGNAPNTGQQQGEAAAVEPEGEGVRLNINTVSRPVLRSMFSPSEIPDDVIDAILRYRNEEVEEEEEASEEEEFIDEVQEGSNIKRKIFTTLDDLDEIPEFKNLPDKKLKTAFLDLLTVKSDVFSVHMAALYKRNEERRVYVMTRLRSVVVRMEGEEEPTIHPVIHMERRNGLRIFPIDFPEEEKQRRMDQEAEMDDFAISERNWNPFRVEFYRKRKPQNR